MLTVPLQGLQIFTVLFSLCSLLLRRPSRLPALPSVHPLFFFGVRFVALPLLAPQVSLSFSRPPSVGFGTQAAPSSVLFMSQAPATQSHSMLGCPELEPSRPQRKAAPPAGLPEALGPDLSPLLLLLPSSMTQQAFANLSVTKFFS